MDVLFLSVSMGAGHRNAAEAVKEQVEKRYANARTMIVDTLSYVNPVVDKLIVGGYLSTVKKTPQIYGKLYSMSESSDNICDFTNTLNRLMSFRIKKLVEQFKPSVIVCTHPFPMQMLSNLKTSEKIDIPVVAIITDYITHSFWYYPNIDAYIVAHEYMKQQMISKGIRPERIHTYGIPVSSSFLLRKNRQVLLKEFRLKNILTVMIMGGSLGYGEMEDTFLSLLNCRTDLQVIAITGKNEKLRQELEKHSQNCDKTVKVIGFTNRVADFMDISDCIITKPGGMTISEALVKELPIFIISPIPGQEERNAHFLINNGLASRILPNDDIDAILYQINSNPVRMRQMKEMCRYFAKPDSSRDILDLMERLVYNKEIPTHSVQSG